uniref:Uncharacterized protein n=1 Tax=Lotus japonicus TaxID=34305 RepID=I3SE22_LOTJA|nr:unknown [Lotus japonicus]
MPFLLQNQKSPHPLPLEDHTNQHHTSFFSWGQITLHRLLEFAGICAWLHQAKKVFSSTYQDAIALQVSYKHVLSHQLKNLN